MHDHIARIQRYLLVIKEQYETIQATLPLLSPENTGKEGRAQSLAYQMLLTKIYNRMRMHDELMTQMQAYVDAHSVSADIEPDSAVDAPSADSERPNISVDDEWMFLYEIDKDAGEFSANDADTDDDMDDDMGDDMDDDMRGDMGDDMGDDTEDRDMLPLTADQRYIQRLNQARPLILEPGMLSHLPGEDFSSELSEQEFRHLFGLDGSTHKRTMNVVEAFGVFGFVLSAEEKQRLLALDEGNKASPLADADHDNDANAEESTGDTRDGDDPDYNVPGAA